MKLLATHPIKKMDLGFHGNLFGGKLLAWIDAAAAGYSMQLCDTPRMVTVAIDKCFFEKPAREGQLVKDSKTKLESAWSKITSRMYQNTSEQKPSDTQDIEFEEVTNS